MSRRLENALPLFPPAPQHNEPLIPWEPFVHTDKDDEEREDVSAQYYRERGLPIPWQPFEGLPLFPRALNK